MTLKRQRDELKLTAPFSCARKVVSINTKCGMAEKVRTPPTEESHWTVSGKVTSEAGQFILQERLGTEKQTVRIKPERAPWVLALVLPCNKHRTLRKSVQVNLSIHICQTRDRTTSRIPFCFMFLSQCYLGRSKSILSVTRWPKLEVLRQGWMDLESCTQPELKAGRWFQNCLPAPKW